MQMNQQNQQGIELYVHIPFCVKKCGYCDFLSFPAPEEVQEAYVDSLCGEIGRKASVSGLEGELRREMSVSGLEREIRRKAPVSGLEREIRREMPVSGLDKPGGRQAQENQGFYGGTVSAGRGFPAASGNYEVSSIFFGGGTPSVLRADLLLRVMDAIRGNFAVQKDAEITVECNPGTLDGTKLDSYQKCGVNRLSIGLQSAQKEELEILGRIHTWEQFLESYRLARAAGFSNCNIDLMMALPGQKPDRYRQTLQEVCALEPEHISAYSLMIEEGTPFFERYGQDAERRERGGQSVLLPSEETERQMYWETVETLGRCGYSHYEISNFAKAGRECRHNLGYWRRTPYLGFGLGASSFWKIAGGEGRAAAGVAGQEAEAGRGGSRADEEVRFENTSYMAAYLAGDFRPRKVQRLSKEARMEETMFLGLRLKEGVSRWEFKERFGVTIGEIYSGMDARLEAEGLLSGKGGRLVLTKRGVDLANYCMGCFLF